MPLTVQLRSRHLATNPAARRSPEFQSGDCDLLLAASSRAARGLQHVTRRHLGIHAQPAIAAADVRAEVFRPRPFGSMHPSVITRFTRPWANVSTHGVLKLIGTLWSCPLSTRVSTAIAVTDVNVIGLGRRQWAIPECSVTSCRALWSSTRSTFGPTQA